MLEALFWGALLLVVYSYAIYPLCLIILSAMSQAMRDVLFVLKGQDKRASVLAVSELPQVAVIISAYNEEGCIAERIENLQALDYPKERIRFLIGSDGSVDKTAEICSGIQDERLVFTDFKQNRGKASVLNDLIEQASADILIFSDANTDFAPDVAKQLCRHFVRNADIKAVCGELDLVDAQSGKNQDGAYWKYERFLKFNEARIGGLLGANGAIYAIRKSAYTPIAPDTAVDDFSIVFRISLEGGLVIYDPESRASEEVAPSQGDEYKRRVRIGSGNFQAFHRFLPALNPKYGALWFCYLSHKVLRWYTPLLLLVSLIASALLSFESLFYAILFLLQLTVYAFSALNRNRPPRFGPFNLLVFWINMNLALGHGALRYYSGNAKGTWGSTNR